jgi:hypothetical protein
MGDEKLAQTHVTYRLLPEVPGQVTAAKVRSFITTDGDHSADISGGSCCRLEVVPFGEELMADRAVIPTRAMSEASLR